MLRGYWRVIIAALGFLILLVLVGALTLSPPSLPQYESGQSKDGAYRPGGSGCDPARLQRLSRRDAENERNRCKEAAEEYRLKSDDLVQQARSADAAEVLVSLTYRQTILMFLGAIIGLITLGAAIYAAWYAKRAAEAAEKGLAHALHSTRAYIAPVSEKVVQNSEQPSSFEANIELRNAGNTPAHGFRTFGHGAFHFSNGGRTPLGGGAWNNGTTNPGQPVKMTYDFDLGDDELRALNEGKGFAKIEILGTYTNAFGEEWIYEHTMHLNRDSLKTGILYTHDAKQYRAGEDEELEANHEPALDLRGGQ